MHPRLVPVRRFLGRIRRALKPDPDRFLRKLSGVVHVGANTGQEREHYEQLGLRVLWVEPIPSVYATLAANIAHLPRQRALQALVTDRDGDTVPLHVANNNGASSSIFDLKEHRDIWPSIDYTETLQLESVTLPTLFRAHQVDAAAYDGLVMDTQGSELLILQGAAPLLQGFHVVQTEAVDFEMYAGCCQLPQLDAFMREHGFRQVARDKFARHPRGGGCYDVTYERR
jgi:FkbM family methyltransferase